MGSIEVVDKKRSFRADIQGLRALAVLSVVIFHISPYHLPGGYLGVDIFFVISGYLIIGQLWRSIKTDTFSFATFYANRFKRLLPALLTVLTISSILAFYLLLPYEYEKYVYSLTSSLLYFSNFLFYSQSGYFSHDLELAPLLHTWSLSVEEQFYLLFPFILILISKFTKIQTRALALLMGIAVRVRS
jgi:peptidoglycan/LPS O-acetylase OafA/YrhL